jgi:hypothetical protein
MLFKKLPVIFCTVLFLNTTYADQSVVIRSPDGNIRLSVNNKNDGSVV